MIVKLGATHAVYQEVVALSRQNDFEYMVLSFPEVDVGHSLALNLRHYPFLHLAHPVKTNALATPTLHRSLSAKH